MDKKEENGSAAVTATDSPAPAGDKPKRNRRRNKKEAATEDAGQETTVAPEKATPAAKVDKTDTKGKSGGPAADDAPKEKREPKQRRPKPEAGKSP